MTRPPTQKCIALALLLFPSTLVAEISHIATQINSETILGFTKDLLQHTGLHTHPTEHGRLHFRQGLYKQLPHSPCALSTHHDAGDGSTCSFLVLHPFSKNPWQIWEYKFHKKLVKGRTLFTIGSDFWITDSFNRGEKAMKH